LPIALASRFLPLKVKAVLRAMTKLLETRQFGGESLGDAVGEIVLGGIVGEVGEGQHHDGESRGLGRRLRSDGRGPVRIEKPPRAAADQDKQCGQRCGERHERRTLLRRGRPRGHYRLCQRGDADPQRVDPDRLGDVLEWDRAEIGDCEIEPTLHLTIGVLGETDAARFADALQPRGDINAIAHQIAVALFDDVAQMNAEAKEDAPVLRHFGIALDHRALHFDREAHRIDDAAELDDAAVAGALDDAAMMHGDERVDQVAAERPEPRQNSIFVRAREPAIADHIGHQNRC
jgi:hypothetical protein